MPLRSVKMKRRIFGFQRRVWWPKWTPASRSSRIVTAGMVAPRFDGRVPDERRAGPAREPAPPRGRSVRGRVRGPMVGPPGRPTILPAERLRGASRHARTARADGPGTTVRPPCRTRPGRAASAGHPALSRRPGGSRGGRADPSSPSRGFRHRRAGAAATAAPGPAPAPRRGRRAAGSPPRSARPSPGAGSARRAACRNWRAEARAARRSSGA